jgi:hypothetical protein
MIVMLIDQFQKYIEEIRMKNKTNLLLDIGVFAAFLIALEPGLTGIAIHEWLSLAVAGTIIVHLLLHWKWITTIGVRYFKNLFHSSRLQFLVDVLFFVAFTTVMMSGILISRSILPALNIQLVENHSWRIVHSLSANISLAMLALHVGLHWKWILNMTKKYISQPLSSLHMTNNRPALVPVKIRNDDQEKQRG